MDDETLRKRAEKIAREKAGFQIHLGIYFAVNLFLIAVWYFTSNPWGSVFPWFIFPLAGWGIGVTGHFIGAYRGERYILEITEREFRRLKQRQKM